MACAVLWSSLANLIISFTAPYFINPSALNWGPKYGYIWFPSCLIAAAFIWHFMPEIHNRSLEEISEMFEAGLPARKFKGYICMGNATAVKGKIEEISADHELADEKELDAAQIEQIEEI